MIHIMQYPTIREADIKDIRKGDIFRVHNETRTTGWYEALTDAKLNPKAKGEQKYIVDAITYQSPTTLAYDYLNDSDNVKRAEAGSRLRDIAKEANLDVDLSIQDQSTFVTVLMTELLMKGYSL